MKHRSYFWPLTLIAVGVIWLLISLGMIPASNLWVLIYIWPLALIGLGVGLILSSFWSYARLFVSLLVVGFALLAVIYAPQFGQMVGPRWGLVSFNGPQAGSGTVITETRSVQDFESISVSYPAEVVVRQGETVSVRVTGEDNVLAQLRIQVRHGVLYVEGNQPYWLNYVVPTRAVVVEVTVTDLRDLDFSSAGSVQIEDLQADALALSISGAGNLDLSAIDAERLDCKLSGAGSLQADGTVQTLDVQVSGLGSFEGADLLAQSADVQLSGVGSATVWVEDKLRADVSGVGSVNYYGSPQVSRQVSGVGSVSRIGSRK
jgi:hypothetical protein